MLRRFLSLVFVCSIWPSVVITAKAQIALPTVVMDHSGNSIHGLQKPDFAVSVAKTATFESAKEVPPFKLSNFTEPIPVFILFDAISAPSPDQGKVTKVLLDLLHEASDKRSPVSLVVNTGDGLRVIHDVGTDSSILASALKQLSSPDHVTNSSQGSNQPPELTQQVNAEVERLRLLNQVFPAKEGYAWLRTRQLGSLVKMGQVLQRLPDRKLLIWITASFPLRVENGQLTLQDVTETATNREECNNPHPLIQSIGTMNSAYAAAIDALNHARISVYPVQVEVRLRTPAMQHDLCAPEALQITRLGLDEMALRTGGRNLGMLDEINLAKTLEDVRRNFDSYYLLTFTPQPNLKISWVNSKVKLNKTDARALAPNGFFAGN